MPRAYGGPFNVKTLVASLTERVTACSHSELRFFPLPNGKKWQAPVPSFACTAPIYSTVSTGHDGLFTFARKTSRGSLPQTPQNAVNGCSQCPDMGLTCAVLHKIVTTCYSTYFPSFFAVSLSCNFFFCYLTRIVSFAYPLDLLHTLSLSHSLIFSRYQTVFISSIFISLFLSLQ